MNRTALLDGGHKGSDALIMGLAHSTLDFGYGLNTGGQDKIMYNYAHYVGNRNAKIRKAIAFEDYNYEGGMGFGIQAAEFIEKGSIIFEIPMIGTHCGKEYFKNLDGKKLNPKSL